MEANLLSERKRPRGMSHCLSDRVSSSRTQSIWHKSAPEAVTRAFRSGKDAKGWSAWKKHLAKREWPVSLSDLLPGGQSPLLWVLPEEVEEGAVRLIERVDRFGASGRAGRQTAEESAAAWLGQAGGAALGPGYLLEALAWCHALPQLARYLPPNLWWQMHDCLSDLVGDAGAVAPQEDPLIHQMAAGELPLALSYLFPEIRPCRKLAKEARRALSAGPIDLVDGEGLPHAEHLGLLRPLLACWTRCRAIGDELSKGCWSNTAQARYELLIRSALRLTRFDGTHVFSRGSAGPWCEDLFHEALRFSDDPHGDQIAVRALPGRKRASTARAGKRDLPQPATHSEWAAVGVLRTDWSRSAPRLTVTYPEDSVRVEFECGHQLLWSGRWELEVRRDGEPLPPESHWEEVCWVSDRDMDYLELEIRLRGGLRVQRHMLLARGDEFLFLADAILGQRRTALEYRGRLPLLEAISLRPAEQTWEGFLVGRSRAALVLPLALPEWRADPQVGRMLRTDRGLELCQAVRGRAMLAPLFFDLKPRRMTRPLTWRHLTVAENLRAQPDDVAVGYRVMVGGQQWLIYRSLAEAGNRTLLGHNLASELLVARFGRDGEVEPLVEIES